jgi:tetratricopeptide (TPR) repeat protein
MAPPPTDPARRVLELFPLLIEARPADRDRLLRDEPPDVRARLRRMLEVETVGFTEAARGAVREEMAPPEQVGDFRLIAPIGRGGMGLVYLAEQGTPRRRVAVKLMRPTLVGPAARRAFQAEVESLARFTGPGFPYLIAAGFDSDWPWLAMSWIQGESIDRWAQAVPFAEQLQALVELCGVVDRAHAQGVAHLDLKPANVLVGADGVTVLDMGIAQVGGALGLGAGTPGWRAPEQVAGAPVDVRSDVYALGRLALEIVGPGTLLDPVIARATSGDPDERPERARVLATELLEALGPSRAAPPSASTFAQRVAVAVHGADPGIAEGVVAIIERAIRGGGELRPAVATLAEALDRGVVRERPAVELRLRLLLVDACVALALDDLAIRQAEASLGLVPHVADASAGPRAHLAAATAWRLQLRVGQAREALALCEAALPPGDPLHAHLAFEHGNLALDAGDAAGAIEHYRKALDVPTPPRSATERLIHALSLSGRLAEAQEQALALLQRETDRYQGAPHLGLAAAHGVCAVAFGEGGDPNRALEHARAEVQVRVQIVGRDTRPTHQAYARLCLAYMGLRRTAEAVEAGQLAAEGSNNPQGALIYAGALHADGQHERAVDICGSVIAKVQTIDPTSKMIPMTQGTLAVILADLGRAREALEQLDLALPVLRSWQAGGKTRAQIEALEALADRLRAQPEGVDDAP